MLKIILVIAIGSLIGWVTNYIAIKMLFRPYVEINLIFFKIQGVIPKRRHEIGVRIAKTVKENIISMKDIVSSLDKNELGEDLEKTIDSLIKGKVKKEIVEIFPMAAMFLSESVVEKIENSIKRIIMNNKDQIFSEIFSSLEEKVDFESIIIKNIDNFSLEELEKITFSLAKTELKHIEVIGAVLGGLIGIVQVVITMFM
ncbi:MAG: DUF445 domain-containing protein [Fusobacteriaceae bacterium]